MLKRLNYWDWKMYKLQMLGDTKTIEYKNLMPHR